jgi:hypothetical protein
MGTMGTPVVDRRIEGSEVAHVSYPHGHEATARTQHADRLQELVEP